MESIFCANAEEAMFETNKNKITFFTCNALVQKSQLKFKRLFGVECHFIFKLKLGLI